MPPKLRPYQIDICQQVNAFFDSAPNNNTLLLVMPTGTGKTTVFSSLASQWVKNGRKVFIAVHRIELVDQIIERLKSFSLNPITPDEIKPFCTPSVIVGMIQSLTTQQQWVPDYIVIDECHHSVATSYHQLFTWNKSAKILGVTATPIRLDGKGFSEFFQKLINPYPMKYFFDNGYLVKPLHYFCSNIDPKFLHLNQDKTDYNFAEQAKYMAKSKAIHHVVHTYQRYSIGKKAVVFATSVQHSIKLAQGFNQLGVPAAHIDGTIPKDERKSIVKQFKKGHITVLCNYDIISEGFDVPDIDTVILARRTKSLSAYIQMVGRALRPDHNKEFGYILDCVGQWIEFGFAGLDYPWSLDFNQNDIHTAKLNQKIFIKNQDKIQTIFDDINEIIGYNFINLDQSLVHVSMFEKLLYEINNGPEESIKPTEVQTAIQKYIDWKYVVGYDWNNNEINYLKKRIAPFGIQLPEDIYQLVNI